MKGCDGEGEDKEKVKHDNLGFCAGNEASKKKTS